MNTSSSRVLVLFWIVLITLSAFAIGQSGQPVRPNATLNGAREVQGGPEADALRMIQEGRQTFRHDTFGDETFWGDSLKLHQAIAGAKLGGVGPGLSPKAALAAGLKLDRLRADLEGVLDRRGPASGAVRASLCDVSEFGRRRSEGPVSRATEAR